MNNIVKKAIAFCAFTGLLITVICVTYNILRWKDTTGEYRSSVEQLYNTEDNLIDVVFVGSSHVYCDIYPCFLWEKAGISSFDMSVAGQDKVSSYYELKELLKTQSPKVVFVDLYGLFSDGNGIEGNRYRNLISMKPSSNSYNHVKEFFKEDKETDINDYLFRFPIVHTRYKELTRLDFEDYIPNYFLRGEEIIFTVGSAAASPTAHDTESSMLSETNQKWLNDLYELSKEKSFDLVLIKTPFYDPGDDQAKVNAAAAFAEERGIGFIDFNKITDELELDYASDFYDGNHTNAYGARKISEYLADYIVQNYSVKDHRCDENYTQWDDDLAFYYREEIKEKIKNASGIYALAALLTKSKSDFSAVISVEYTSSIENNIDEYCDALDRIGFEYDDLLMGGKWLYRNGELQFLSGNDSESPVMVYELNNVDTLSVKFSSDGAPENVMIGTADYSHKGTYIDITVYDEVLKEVVVNQQY